MKTRSKSLVSQKYSNVQKNDKEEENKAGPFQINKQNANLKLPKKTFFERGSGGSGSGNKNKMQNNNNSMYMLDMMEK